MAVQIKPDQAFAYSEILEILELMEEEDVKKVPQKLIDIFEKNALPTYEKHFDVNKPLAEQGVSPKTAALIAMLTLNYWCESEEEKRELTNLYNENERKYQQEMREKYNPDKIFDNPNNITGTPKPENNEVIQHNYNPAHLPLDYNMFPWYKKIFTQVRVFILNLLKKI